MPEQHLNPSGRLHGFVTAIDDDGSVSYLLRVVLPDRPGMLGAVASALGRATADIIGVDVVERGDDGTVVDDFVVDLAAGRMPDGLVSACQSIPGVEVEYVGRYPAGADLHRDLEAIEAMTENPTDAERTLVDLLPGVFRADWAMILRLIAGTTHLEYGVNGPPAADSLTVPWLPLDKPRVIDATEEWAPESWHEAAVAAVPLESSVRVLVLGRDGGPSILASELARLGHLATLAVSIQQAVGPSDGPGLVDRLDHLVLTVSDVWASVAFYRDVLGMQPVTYGSGRHAVRFGKLKINLHDLGEDTTPQAAHPVPGSADLCLVAATTLDAVLERLAKHDVPVELGPVARIGALGPMTSIYFRDPDHNLIEVATYA
jgi:catechol 2,3-dioxygenase-like lactoylglutathione lyase family enzyme